MGFKELASLDAEVTIAIGKTNKETGKPYPKSAEGYFLGSRTVKSKRGDSTLHFLQTPKGNLGVWGTTDLDRKLAQAAPGVMVRITSTGTKPTPNGEMYTYKVEVDGDNTVDVSGLGTTLEADGDNSGGDYEDSGDSDEDDDNQDYDAGAVASARAARAAEVQAMLNKRSKKA